MAARQATGSQRRGVPERDWATDPATLTRVSEALTRQLHAGMPMLEPAGAATRRVVHCRAGAPVGMRGDVRDGRPA